MDHSVERNIMSSFSLVVILVFHLGIVRTYDLLESRLSPDEKQSILNSYINEENYMNDEVPNDCECPINNGETEYQQLIK